MADIDFARIATDAIVRLLDTPGDEDWPLPSNEAVAVLDTPVPALCPDCEGKGIVPVLGYSLASPDGWSYLPCPHPNAPTIGRLLRIGEAVMRAAERNPDLARVLRTVE